MNMSQISNQKGRQGIFTALAVSACIFTTSASAAVVIFQNDFNNPTGWVESAAYDDLSTQTVNSLFGSNFTQTNTVETIRNNGTRAFRNNLPDPPRGYRDPLGIGGDYSLGMLQSGTQDDELALTFDAQGFGFVNFSFDFSASGLSSSGSNTNAFFQPNVARQISVTLYDTPSGTFDFNNRGAILSSSVFTGLPLTSTDPVEYNWSQVQQAFSMAGSTNDNVTLVFNTLNNFTYTTLDNFFIEASNNTIPEPSTAGLLIGALSLSFFVRRR